MFADIPKAKVIADTMKIKDNKQALI